MALKLDILANTRQFTSEMKKSGASVEDISDSLDEMAREGKQAGDKLERTFKDIAQDAKKADKAVEKVGDSGKKGFAKASGSSGEFKDEALANFSEVTSSFDGSMGSIAELAQGTLGGVASSIPGLGLAAGAVAIGIGAITSEFTAAQEKAAETKQSIVDDFLELGDALDKEAVDARVRDILAVDDTRKQAKVLGDILDVNVGQAALIMAGDFESAGVTAEEAIEGINNAGGDVEFSTWLALQNTLKATEEGYKAGEEAAEAQAESSKRTAKQQREDQEKVRTSVDRTKRDLQKLMGTSYKGKVTLEVDDRAVRNWKPPQKIGTVVYQQSGQSNIRRVV